MCIGSNGLDYAVTGLVRLALFVIAIWKSFRSANFVEG